MYRTRHVNTRQLIALLLMAVMLLVHITKVLHTHASNNAGPLGKQENVISQNGPIHTSCTICEFQLAKDAPHINESVLVVAPVYTAPTYSRLLTAINPDRLFNMEGRGPPHA